MGVLKEAALSRSDRIRTLNDLARKPFLGAQVVVTAAFAELHLQTKAMLLERVRTFNDFDEDNDPHHEHDMAFFEYEGERYFFKFDYYDKSMKYGSDDPGDPSKTQRVLTIGFASDY